MFRLRDHHELESPSEEQIDDRRIEIHAIKAYYWLKIETAEHVVPLEGRVIAI